MTAFSLGIAALGRLENNADEPKLEKPMDAAWIVLEAANDLRDDATVEACRRVIDASLKGVAAAPADEYIVQHYFR